MDAHLPIQGPDREALVSILTTGAKSGHGSPNPFSLLQGHVGQGTKQALKHCHALTAFKVAPGSHAIHQLKATGPDFMDLGALRPPTERPGLGLEMASLHTQQTWSRKTNQTWRFFTCSVCHGIRWLPAPVQGVPAVDGQKNRS